MDLRVRRVGKRFRQIVTTVSTAINFYLWRRDVVETYVDFSEGVPTLSSEVRIFL